MTRDDLCPLPELLSHTRFDLMIEAALAGSDMRSRVERHGMLWEDGAWWSAEHPVDDGAARIPLLGGFGEDEQLDAVGEAVAVAAMDHQREDDPREEQEVDPDAVRRLVAAGTAVDERLLLDALIFEELDLGHAVTVARATGMIYPARSGAEAREPLA